MATAAELFESRHYPSVVAVVSNALEDEPDHVPLLLLRARARIALRRDLEAQADLRDVIRIDPKCSLAYRLLGQLAVRREENQSATNLFREALRLDPGDREATDWLAICDSSRPAAAVHKLPAPAAAAGRFPRKRTEEGVGLPPHRFAKGTCPPPDDDETSTEPYRVRRTASTEPIPLAAGSQDRRVTESPGFGDYLVATGILTRERLRAAQAYQRSMKVQLSTAIVTLGLATPQRIQWAVVAHQSQLAKQG
jgi:tetratricopeptide (TPR) repeat protein